MDLRLAIPRPPVGPDLLRRIEVPDDLEAITTRGDEADPDAGGLDRDGVERIWAMVERLTEQD